VSRPRASLSDPLSLLRTTLAASNSGSEEVAAGFFVPPLLLRGDPRLLDTAIDADKIDVLIILGCLAICVAHVELGRIDRDSRLFETGSSESLLSLLFAIGFSEHPFAPLAF
jgi:hypothetical protein